MSKALTAVGGLSTCSHLQHDPLGKQTDGVRVFQALEAASRGQGGTGSDPLKERRPEIIEGNSLYL
jgi:hypothetical protein